MSVPVAGGAARRRALLRLAASAPLLLLWAVPGDAWPGGMGAAVDLFWAVLPGLAYAGMALGFARSLLPGHEPVIARYNRFDETKDPAECAGHARRLTLFWAVALALAAAADLLAVARGVDLGWGPDAVLLALFLGEHALRSLLFPAGGIAWPSQTLRAIMRAERARHG
ncbi:hypothetical protein [Muricoccus pecuniae]|uniref:Putative membrane protein n=1 Tax=Muricoccus pecuniae TaxID=693023 RepID=A0A840YJD8_9PROT|nr:hypothetical protein [Roseomonas pecuniae]MBB5694263.1 putative membrane protein [Roseomonas pecuniae]